MDIFKAFGINKHMPTPKEFAEHLNDNPNLITQMISYMPFAPDDPTDDPSEGWTPAPGTRQYPYPYKESPAAIERRQEREGMKNARRDAIRDFEEDVDPRFEREPEIKPHMSAHEVRQSGMIPGMKPDPEPGTVSRNVRQRTSGGYPDKEKIIRKPGDYINPPYGESDLDTK